MAAGHLNGTITINTGATFTCRNIIRVGRAGMGTVNINGTMRANSVPADWQGIFIGVLSGGNGTVNVNDGGALNGGYQVEVGTRDFYPTGVLNVNEGGLSEAYWETWIGPNGTINVNGGTVNAGKVLNVGNLFLDNAPNAGTLGAVVGTLNINSGIVTVNHNDLEGPIFAMHNDAKITIDNGSLRIMRTGTDFSADINAHVTAGRIVPATGKEINVAYDGIYTTVTAQVIAGVSTLSKNAFTVYPNPATDFINIQSENGLTDSVNVTIVNMLGEVVVQNKVNAVSGSIDLSTLAAGIYMVKTESGDISSVTKIIKK
ncbi:MAG: T9SS type A sorting domain-containing protein [Bacteroidota bacterium]